MPERHLRRLPEGERRRRKHQKRRGALRRHARKPRRLVAAVGPDAIDQRKFRADFLLRNLEYTPLFVEGTRADLRRMRVNGNRRKPFDRRHVAQMLAEALFVDREIVVERQPVAAWLFPGVRGDDRWGLSFPFEPFHRWQRVHPSAPQSGSKFDLWD